MPILPEPFPHTVDAIYRAIAARAGGGDSLGVPVSDAVNECERATWYKFRWAAPREEITGQKERRFETGRREEERILDDLEAAGVTVERVDPATGKQWRIELANGWLRGKMDARAYGVTEAPKTEHVVEVKTHNDRSFKELLKHAPPKGGGIKETNDVEKLTCSQCGAALPASKGDGIRIPKLSHFAQCQLYMHASGIKRCLYLAVNKNDESLYAERIEYDAAFCLAIEARIARISSTDRAPARLHDDPKAKAAFACQWCPALALCHEGAFARRNCRTCLSVEFRDGALVHCTLHERDLSYDEQQDGCGDHLYLPDLVAGEQIDAGERWVKYSLPSGEWIDGRAA